MDHRKSDSSILVELSWFDNLLTVFIIRSDLTTPHVESSSFSSVETERIVNELPSVLAEADGMFRAPAWGHLSELICGPLRKHLRISDRVIIVPYGLFHFLPLHLLLIDDAPLIESHAVIYSPSASVLRYCQQKNPKRVDHQFQPRTATIIGLDFENEAEMVAHYFEAPQVLTSSRTRITKELVISSCRTVDVIHFSAHGEFTPGEPRKSGLVLPIGDDEAEPRYLTLSDVYDMNLDSYLVTLGACSSGLGDYASGDEVIGLTRGFLYAGTPSVIASLWPVHHQSTLLLMDRFYACLMGDGFDKADALRKSQLEVRKQFPAPGDWSGFILTGDWI